MVVKVTGRRGGKTHFLFEQMIKDPHAIMLQPTIQMVRMIQDEYPVLKGRIFAYSELNNLKGKNYSDLYVDNLDILLGTILGQTPKIVTITGLSI